MSSLSVWSQLYMETTIQSIKVVEPNNFLMYIMHDAVIKSARRKGVWPCHTVYCMFSCIYFNVHISSIIVHLNSV